MNTHTVPTYFSSTILLLRTLHYTTVIPPPIAGHTYVGRSTPHCPHLTFDPVDDTVSPAAVTFPPTNVDKSAFCSIAMKNTSDLPVLFKVLPDLEKLASIYLLINNRIFTKFYIILFNKHIL